MKRNLIRTQRYILFALNHHGRRKTERLCKFFVSCHSAEHFFVFKLIVHPKRSFLFEVKTKAASFGLRGGNKIEQDVFDGLSFKLYYTRVLQDLLQRL